VIEKAKRGEAGNVNGKLMIDVIYLRAPVSIGIIIILSLQFNLQSSQLFLKR